MPPRPFPFQLGVGTDIVHVRRVRAILTQGDGNREQMDRYMRRFLTHRERNEVLNRYQTGRLSTDKEIDIVSKHLAGRWAAKEATIKAVSWRKLSFHDIVIKRPRYGGGMHAVILDKTDQSEVPLGPAVNILGQYESDAAQSQPYDIVNDAGQRSDVTQDETSDQKSHSKGASSPDMTLQHMVGSRSHSQQEPGDVHYQSYYNEHYDDISGQIAQISISHDGDYATAVCLAVQEPMDGDVGGEAAARNHL